MNKFLKYCLILASAAALTGCVTNSVPNKLSTADNPFVTFDSNFEQYSEASIIEFEKDGKITKQQAAEYIKNHPNIVRDSVSVKTL